MTINEIPPINTLFRLILPKRIILYKVKHKMPETDRVAIIDKKPIINKIFRTFEFSSSVIIIGNNNTKKQEM